MLKNEKVIGKPSHTARPEIGNSGGRSVSAGPAGTLGDLGAVAGPWLLSVLILKQTLLKNKDQPARRSPVKHE